MSVVQLVTAAVMMFVGSTVLGIVGFGTGVVSMPVLLLVLTPQSAVVMLNTVALGLKVWIAVQSWHDLPLKKIGPITIAALLGAPIGVFILDSVEAGVLRIGISAFIVLLALLTVLKPNGGIPMPYPVGLLVGFAVGITSSAFGVGGPLVALFLLNRGWPKLALRASMAFYLMATGIVAIVGYAVAGLYTRERVALVLLAIVPVLTGLKVGSILMRRMDERAFRYAALAVIFVSSGIVLAKEALQKL